MNRNLFVFAGLVLVQLGIALMPTVMPVDWGWQVGLGVVLGIGAIASLLFTGSQWRRLGLVAISAALPCVLAETFGWSDRAYPGLGYIVAAIITAVACFGAFVALAIFGKRLPQEKSHSP